MGHFATKASHMIVLHVQHFADEDIFVVQFYFYGQFDWMVQELGPVGRRSQ